MKKVWSSNEWILFKFVIYPLLIFLGADVHAKDKGGLVPLHNACSYGHYEVTELLVKHGASVNVCDLWRFTPLHEVSHRELEQMEARVDLPGSTALKAYNWSFTK